MTPSDRGDRNGTDFGWLDIASRRMRSVAEDYELNWNTQFNIGADLQCITHAEVTLGYAFPPSLRTFLLRHDGGTVAGFRILGVREICEETLRSKSEDPQTYDESSDDFLTIVDIGDGNSFRLDIGYRDEDGESPVVDAPHECGPRDWHKARVAESFGDWLRDVFDQVLCQELMPAYPGWEIVRLEDASISPNLYHRKGRELALQGYMDEARAKLLRAIAFRSFDDFDGFASDVDAVSSIHSMQPGDQLIDRILNRAVEARQIAIGRRERVIFDLMVGQRQPDFIRQIEARLGTALKPHLLGLAGIDGVGFSFSQGTTALALYGGGRFRPAIEDPYMPIEGAPKRSIVIGEIREEWGWGSPMDYLLEDESSTLFRASFAGMGSGAPVAVSLKCTLDMYLDEMLDAYRAGRTPLTVGAR